MSTREKARNYHHASVIYPVLAAQDVGKIQAPNRKFLVVKSVHVFCLWLCLRLVTKNELQFCRVLAPRQILRVEGGGGMMGGSRAVAQCLHTPMTLEELFDSSPRQDRSRSFVARN